MKHFLFKLNRLLARARPFLSPAIKILFLALFLFLLFSFTKKAINFAKNHGLTGKDFLALTKNPADLLDSTNDLTNFLILGLRDQQEGSWDLTDTIIIASYNHPNQSISLISVPRDLWVSSLKTKINAVYHYGNLKQEKGGPTLAKAAIQETLGIPIHYSVVINFQAFIEAIDLLGGLEINVQNSFIDHYYPIPGKEDVYPETARYQTIEFQNGLQVMDGQTALKYVRSRQAEGPEGNDFARSRRQQQVISALRRRLLLSGFLLSKKNFTDLVAVASRNITTDVDPGLYPTLVKLALTSKDTPLNSIPLTSEKETESDLAILETGDPKKFNNQWVLIARDNNWDALKQYLYNKLKGLQ